MPDGKEQQLQSFLQSKIQLQTRGKYGRKTGNPPKLAGVALINGALRS